MWATLLSRMYKNVPTRGNSIHEIVSGLVEKKVVILLEMVKEWFRHE